MEYVIHLGIFTTMVVIAGLSLNLVLGFTGLVSVTHAAFYGIGSYATAIHMTKFGWNFFPALGAGVVYAMCAAFLIGLVLSRFRGDYYALGSLGFNFIMFGIALNWHDLTNGPLGITSIMRPSLFGYTFVTPISFLFLSIALMLVVLLIAWRIAQSSFGRVLKAIREDETALEVFGYRALWYKLTVFTISAGLIAIVGGLFASYISFIDQNVLNVNESVFFLAVVILGGLANLKGTIIASVLLQVIPELFRFIGLPSEFAGQIRQALYGLLLIVLMLYRPRGLLGEYKL